MNKSQAIDTFYVQNKIKTAYPGSIEQIFLSCSMFFIYVLYASIGRDVFVNRLYYPEGADVYDPIGKAIPYLQVLTCVTVTIVICNSTSINWALSKIAWLFAPFCLLAMASNLWADSPFTFRYASILALLWVALSLLIHRIGLLQSAKVSIHLLAIVCILSFFMAIAFPHIGRHDGLELVQSVHKGRWRGIFGHKNGLAPWAAYGSVFLFTHSWLCKGPRLYWWLARVSAVTCLVFAGSATGVVVAVMASATSVFFYMLRRLALPTTLLISVLGCAAVLVFYLSASSLIFEALGRDETLTGRSVIWQLAAEYFWENPILGNGFSSMGGVVFNQKILALTGQAIIGPESAYFTMVLDLGILGAICFVVPYVIAIKNGFEWLKHVNLKERAAIEMFLILLLTQLVDGISESSVVVTTGYDGILCFTPFIALMTTPKSPQGVLRGEFRLAKYRLPPLRSANGAHVRKQGQAIARKAGTIYGREAPPVG